jgi:hypothetical protein
MGNVKDSTVRLMMPDRCAPHKSGSFSIGTFRGVTLEIVEFGH